MEAPNKLNVLKMSGEYMRNMETAIQYGFPVLLEDVGEVLDATLEPLLLKQIFKHAHTLRMTAQQPIADLEKLF